MGGNLLPRLDSLFLNKFLGLPVFAFIMWLVFKITFTLSQPATNIIQLGIGYIRVFLKDLFGINWISNLINDGVLNGVGAILGFLPQIFLVFFMLAFLEHSGYLHRAAALFSRLMGKIGLSGMSFFPLMLGFGCTVPAVMASRSIKNKADRLLTILVAPFISCSARLPVYILLAGIFFKGFEDLVLLSLYGIGILMAIISALILRKFLLKSKSLPVYAELPQLKLPKFSQMFHSACARSRIFLKNAGTMILSIVIIVWILASLPAGVEYASENSILGRIGSFASPIFKPLGFGNWQSVVSLATGFVAKEVVIGTLGTLYGSDLNTALQGVFTPLSAYAFMVFVLLYVPCIAAMATIKSETKSVKWAAFSIVYTTGVAWAMSFLVFQGGKLLGFS